MKIPSAKETLRSNLILPGLIFLGINLTYSYRFHQVNSYKILLMLLGISLLVLWYDIFRVQVTETGLPWKFLLLLFIPLLAALPGYFLHEGRFNYNFPYELATGLIFITWAVYLYRSVRKEKDLPAFIFLIALSVIYVSLWAILEGFGIHPLLLEKDSVDRVQSVFGNINYLAGFLVVLLPLFFLLALPKQLLTAGAGFKKRMSLSKSRIFYLCTFMLGTTSLYLTKTRAAIAAFFLGIFLVMILYAFMFGSKVQRKKILISGLMILVVLMSAFYFFPGQFKNLRIEALFTLRGWAGRLIPWQAALASIKTSPWLGYGLGSSYNLFFRFVNPDARLYYEDRSYNHAHSEILECLQEGGFLGAAAFFFFWVYLFRSLVRILGSKSINRDLSKIAIGLLGCFSAYHIHSFFSVAPRMVAVKLPLFAQFALLFILIKLNTAEKATEEKGKAANGLVMKIVPLVFISFIWIYHMPWLIKQYQFEKIRKEPPSLMRIKRLEKLTKKYPDIYALDFLSQEQIQHERVRKLGKTLKKMDEIFPLYRETGFKKALYYDMKHDLDRAVRSARSYQERDRYFLPNIYSLFDFSLRTADPELFFQQFELLIRTLVFQHRLVENQTADEVRIIKNNKKELLVIHEQGDVLEFQWNEALIDDIFTAARLNRQKKSWEKSERVQCLSFISHLFFKQPYFQIQITEARYERKPQVIYDAVNGYYETKKQWRHEKNRLKKKYEQKLDGMEAKRMRILEKKYRAAIETTYKPYKKKMKAYETFLQSTTDWKTYSARKNFTNELVEQIARVMSPK